MISSEQQEKELRPRKCKGREYMRWYTPLSQRAIDVNEEVRVQLGRPADDWQEVKLRRILQRKREVQLSYRERRTKFDARVKELEEKIAELEEEVRLLKCMNESLTSRVKDLQKKEHAKPPLADLLDLLTRMRVPFRAGQLVHGLLLAAQTPQEVAAVCSSRNVVKNCSTAIARAHIDAQLEQVLRCSKADWRIFGSLGRAEQLRFSHVVVNGRSLTRLAEPGFIAYINLELDFRGREVLCAHADGKFSSCPRGFKQSFEFRLRYRVGNEQRIVTFACGLLPGTDQKCYEHFFRVVKNHHCPWFPFLVVDFESAVANAALQVWKNVEIRGCYFHYEQNVHRRKRRIERWIRQPVSRQVLNLVALLPFLRRSHTYLLRLVRDLGLSGEDLFRSADFKIINYVHSIYDKRFQGWHRQDLGKLLVRTNNVCEGKNSAMERFFGARLRVQDYAAYVSCVFKQDLFSPTSASSMATSFDQFLLSVQKASADNMEKILTLCAQAECIKSSRAAVLLESAHALATGIKHRISSAQDEEARLELDSLSRSYYSFSLNKRREFRRESVDRFSSILSSLDVENMKDLYDKVSTNTTKTQPNSLPAEQPDNDDEGEHDSDDLASDKARVSDGQDGEELLPAQTTKMEQADDKPDAHELLPKRPEVPCFRPLRTPTDTQQ